MAVTVELVTTITIVLIGIVVAVYLIVLKRNGWIGKSTNYRCPNPACKSIFQNPMEVTDLADVNRTHFACPKCGYDLDMLAFTKKITSKNQPNLKTEQIPTQSNDLKINETGNIKSTTETKPPFANNIKASPETKPSVVSNTQSTPETKPTFVFDAKNTSEIKPPVVNSTKNTHETKPIVVNNTKDTPETTPPVESKEIKPNTEITHKSFFKRPTLKNKEVPSGCKFYLGYLSTLEKGAAIPYQCYVCVKLIDCYKSVEEEK